MDVLYEAMAVQDGEKGGNDFLVTAVEFTVAAGESGINIKIFHVPTVSWAADERSESV